MFVAVVTPPAGPVVSLDEAKAHLRVDHDDEDAFIAALVAAATSVLDGPDGILGRALSAQVLQATYDGFPPELDPPCDPWRPGMLRTRAEGLALPCQPVTAINDVTYVAADGTVTDIDPATYDLTADGRLRLAYGQSWPTPRDRHDPVTILYTAGYPQLPPPLRAAILLMVGDLYQNREESAQSRDTAIAMSTTVDRLISPYRNLRA